MEHHWSHCLRESLNAEFGDRPNVATLATVDGDARPRARTVVVREIDDRDHLLIVSDARSEKNHQLAHTGSCELVFWLPTRREQYRLTGLATIATVTDDPQRVQRLWRALPEATRAMFHWPAPGQPRAAPDDAFPATLPADAPPPHNFTLISFRADLIDRLQLAIAPHRRTRWNQRNAYAPEDVNP